MLNCAPAEAFEPTRHISHLAAENETGQNSSSITQGSPGPRTTMCAPGHEAASAHIVVSCLHRGDKLRNAGGRVTEACIQLQDPLAPCGVRSGVPGKIGIHHATILRRPDVHHALIYPRARRY